MALLTGIVRGCAALLAATLVSASAWAGTVAPAPANYIFSFQGECIDCLEPFDEHVGDEFGTATLTLQNYVLGADLEVGNFVDFTYSSPLPLDLNADDIISISGRFFSTGASTADLSIDFSDGGTDYRFVSNLDGSWSIGPINFNADFGDNHLFNGTLVAAPEPASLVVFGAGLFGLGYLRRRRA